MNVKMTLLVKAMQNVSMSRVLLFVNVIKVMLITKDNVKVRVSCSYTSGTSWTTGRSLLLFDFAAIECYRYFDISNGYIVGGESSSYLLNSVIEFACDDGYKLYGSASMSCQEDGSWNGKTPTCEG